MSTDGPHFQINPSTLHGIAQQKLDTNTKWVITDTGFKILLPPRVSVCNMKPGAARCDTGWIATNVLVNRVRSALSVPRLEQTCTNLKKTRDRAVSYRLDCVMAYLCVKQHDLKTHLTGRDIVYSCELGLGGIMPSSILAVLNGAFIALQRRLRVRVHYISSIELQLTKGGVPVGGCPELINIYREFCHPSVCICEGDRQTGNLCQHSFIDSLLGSDLDIKTAHPCVVTSCDANGKVTNFKYLSHTIARLADDMVFGGLLSRLGLVLRLTSDTSTSSPLGLTTFENRRIEILINTVKCAKAKLFTEAILHECAHARVLADMPHYIMGEPEPHGREWLLRMSDIRRILAYRLTDNSHALCRKGGQI